MDNVNDKIKLALTGVVAIIVLIVIYKIYKYISGGLSGATDGLGLTLSEDAKKNSITTLGGEGTAVIGKTSFTKDSYVRMATQLYTAMKGIGTDNDTVKNVLNAQKSQNDWNALIQAFGIKEDQNLIEWLRGEYRHSQAWNNASRIATLGIRGNLTSGQINSILMSHGIKHNLI